MELACLSALGFDLNVHPHEYEKFVLKLERMASAEYNADIQVWPKGGTASGCSLV